MHFENPKKPHAAFHFNILMNLSCGCAVTYKSSRLLRSEYKLLGLNITLLQPQRRNKKLPLTNAQHRQILFSPATSGKRSYSPWR
jgi:hypothetical protein